MSFDHKEYNREWMRKVREEKRKEKMLSQGKCPVCELLLASRFHVNCSYLDGETSTDA